MDVNDFKTAYDGWVGALFSDLKKRFGSKASQYEYGLKVTQFRIIDVDPYIWRWEALASAEILQGLDNEVKAAIRAWITTMAPTAKIAWSRRNAGYREWMTGKLVDQARVLENLPGMGTRTTPRLKAFTEGDYTFQSQLLGFFTHFHWDDDEMNAFDLHTMNQIWLDSVHKALMDRWLAKLLPVAEKRWALRNQSYGAWFKERIGFVFKMLCNALNDTFHAHAMKDDLLAKFDEIDDDVNRWRLSELAEVWNEACSHPECDFTDLPEQKSVMDSWLADLEHESRTRWNARKEAQSAYFESWLEDDPFENLLGVWPIKSSGAHVVVTRYDKSGQYHLMQVDLAADKVARRVAPKNVYYVLLELGASERYRAHEGLAFLEWLIASAISKDCTFEKYASVANLYEFVWNLPISYWAFESGWGTSSLKIATEAFPKEAEADFANNLENEVLYVASRLPDQDRYSKMLELLAYVTLVDKPVLDGGVTLQLKEFRVDGTDRQDREGNYRCEQDGIENEDGTCAIVAVYQILRKTTMFEFINQELKSIIRGAIQRGTYNFSNASCPIPPKVIRDTYRDLYGEEMGANGNSTKLVMKAIVLESPNLSQITTLDVPMGREFDHDDWNNQAVLNQEITKLGANEQQKEFMWAALKSNRGDYFWGTGIDQVRALLLYLGKLQFTCITAGVISYTDKLGREPHAVAFVKCDEDVRFFNWGVSTTGTDWLQMPIAYQHKFFSGVVDEPFYVREINFLWERSENEQDYRESKLKLDEDEVEKLREMITTLYKHPESIDLQDYDNGTTMLLQSYLDHCPPSATACLPAKALRPFNEHWRRLDPDKTVDDALMHVVMGEVHAHATGEPFYYTPSRKALAHLIATIKELNTIDKTELEREAFFTNLPADDATLFHWYVLNVATGVRSSLPLAAYDPTTYREDKMLNVVGFPWLGVSPRWGQQLRDMFAEPWVERSPEPVRKKRKQLTAVENLRLLETDLLQALNEEMKGGDYSLQWLQAEMKVFAKLNRRLIEASKDQLPVVDVTPFMDAGADPNARDPYGTTPLMYASKYYEWFPANFIALASGGASPALVQFSGESLAHYNKDGQQLYWKHGGFTDLTFGGQPAGSAELRAVGTLRNLIKSKFEPRLTTVLEMKYHLNQKLGKLVQDNEKRTAQGIRALLEAGADANTRPERLPNDDSWRGDPARNPEPLYLAISSGERELKDIIDVLVEFGANLYNAYEACRSKYGPNSATVAMIDRLQDEAFKDIEVIFNSDWRGKQRTLYSWTFRRNTPMKEVFAGFFENVGYSSDRYPRQTALQSMDGTQREGVEFKVPSKPKLSIVDDDTPNDYAEWNESTLILDVSNLP